MRPIHSVLLSSTFFLACSGKTLDAGSNDSGLLADPGQGGAVDEDRRDTPAIPLRPLPQWPDLADCTADPELSLAGEWEGYFEGMPPGNGSDHFRLTILSGDETHLCGSIVYGTGNPPPPATDPDAYYPPGFASGGLGPLPFHSPFPGVAYSLLSGSIVGTRVRFETSNAELYKGWCALQTPLPTDRGYNCIPNGMGWIDGEACFVTDNLTNSVAEYPCDRVGLCRAEVCACDESTCTASEYSDYAGFVPFDISFDADEALGSSFPANVRLRRVE